MKSNYQHCTNCRWFVEIIGLCKPHPLRCGHQAFTHGPNEHGQLVPLPERKWCMYWKPEDGIERMMPLEEGT